MSQPDNQREQFEPLGKVDKKLGEFWMKNPWDHPEENLSAYERNFALINMGRGKFLDVSHMTQADIDSDSRGVAVGDVTGDGMPDLLVRSSGGGPLRVFENRFPKRNWLTVSLRGVKSNRLGLGAKLKIEADGRVLWRELYPVFSFASQLPSEVRFGLGSSAKIDRLTIHWPSGEDQVLTGVPLNRRIRVTEGSAKLHLYPAKPAVSSAGSDE